MMARSSIRVQAQTGGDLAHVLETLATTIKDRRRIFRKMGMRSRRKVASAPGSSAAVTAFGWWVRFYSRSPIWRIRSFAYDVRLDCVGPRIRVGRLFHFHLIPHPAV